MNQCLGSPSEFRKFASNAFEGVILVDSLPGIVARYDWWRGGFRSCTIRCSTTTSNHTSVSLLFALQDLVRCLIQFDASQRTDRGQENRPGTRYRFICCLLVAQFRGSRSGLKLQESSVRADDEFTAERKWIAIYSKRQSDLQALRTVPCPHVSCPMFLRLPRSTRMIGLRDGQIRVHSCSSWRLLTNRPGTRYRFICCLLVARFRGSRSGLKLQESSVRADDEFTAERKWIAIYSKLQSDLQA